MVAHLNYTDTNIAALTKLAVSYVWVAVNETGK